MDMPKDNCCRLCIEAYKMKLNTIASRCFSFDSTIIKNNYCNKAFVEKDGLRYFISKPCNECTRTTVCYNFQRAKVKK
jgi:hypothetical protein